jgi:hypothetical protein
MTPESHDPREIPVLTDSIETGGETGAEAAHAAILADALQSAESLLRRAAREIDPPRFESLFERLRSELPELVERMMREMRD